jgi:2,3-bisphosphoglycerate-dependent phosphoglycerate mutase
MQLYFIRHAQSVNNVLWTQTQSWQGRSVDPELSEVGQQQAALLAQFLARTNADFDPDRRDDHNRDGFGLTHVYTSLMLRAVSTAASIAEALGLPLVAWIDLHETGGIYDNDPETSEPLGLPGRNRAAFEAQFPHLVLPASLDHTGWWNRPFEMPEEWPIRARRFLSEMIERHGSADDRVAVISHGAFYNHFLAALLKLPPTNGVWFDINNAAITRIDFRDSETALVYMNRTDYLPKELIT